MAYRISYQEKLVVATANRPDDGARRTETFTTEFEALERARQLIEEGEYHAVAVCDDSGGVLGGIRLQLKLGFTTE